MVKESVTLLLGGETTLRDSALQKIRAEVFADPSEALMNEYRWSPAQGDISELLTQAQTAPFLSSRRLLIAENLETLKAADRPLLTETIKRTSAHAAWVLIGDPRAVEDSDARKKATAWFNTLAALGAKVDCSTPFREGDIKGWIVKRFRELGKNADARVADTLLDRVGKTLTQLDLAIERLVIYRKDAPSVTAADAEALLGRSAEENAFEIIAAVKTRGPAAAIRIVRALRAEGVSVQEVLSPIAFQFDQLLKIKNCLAQGLGVGDVAERFFWRNTYRAGQAAELVRNLSGERLRADLGALIECEESMKRGELDETEALESCVLRLGSAVELER